MKKQKRWTPEELEFLKENYSKMSTKELMEKLGRSKDSIVGKAYYLKLEIKHVWTDEEIEILKKYYPIFGSKVSQLSRSRIAIKNMAIKLGLKYTGIHKSRVDFLETLEEFFDEDEIEEIIEERE